MECLHDDLKELLLECSEFTKKYLYNEKERSELQSGVAALSERLKISQDSEQKLRLKLQERQENILQLQKILNGFVNAKDENEFLKEEIKKHKELLSQEKRNYWLEKGKWAEDKEKIIKNNREEVEELKKIRNMEVASLNREINRIHEETDKKIQFLKNEIENDYKGQLSRTIMSYEEKLARLSRDLISTQSELRNLRHSYHKTSSLHSVTERPTKERYIPQPLSFARYKPIVPVVSTASQLMKSNEEESHASPERTEFTEINSNPPKKKKMLYSRTDDFL